MSSRRLKILLQITIIVAYFMLHTFGKPDRTNHKIETQSTHICASKKEIKVELNEIDPINFSGAATLILFMNTNILIDSCLKECCRQLYCDKVLYHRGICTGIKTTSSDTDYSVGSRPGYDWKHLSKRDLKSSVYSRECEYGLLECPQNEHCETGNSKKRNGFCACDSGFLRDVNGYCKNMTEDTTSENPWNYGSMTPSNVTENLSTTVEPLKSSTPPTVEKLVVNINNKTVELEDGTTKYKSATLSAYAIGDQRASFSFKWQVLHKPVGEGDGSISDTNKKTILLTNLVPGVYVCKVQVTGENAYGEATGNITVIPARHKNEPPEAVVVPPSQSVKLPNSGVILDGSGSTDDGQIISYHWELLTGPIGYKLTEENAKTLQLSDLVPGNYTVMLKVKDDKDLEGNATAIVYVAKETDYPPTANAGGDKIIYLPQTEIVLNGSASSDDHGILEWEWTKGPEDSGNAVDMQDTRTPNLHLSNLEEGHYHFILKVVDTTGQTANSTSHVYVHASADNILQANAGRNISIIIPVTSALLDGSESTGVSSQSRFLWELISGPTSARIFFKDHLKTNVSELTRGTYAFKLTIWNSDTTFRNSTSSVYVSVTQEKNEPPVARAGTDFSVTLPATAVVINGTESSDDIKIVKWLWVRDPMSIAAGHVVKKSDHSPVLLLTDVVPGRYVWNLTVWDDQGAASTDSVSIIVKYGPHHLDEVEIVIGIGIESLSSGQLNNLIKKLELLLHSSSDVSLDVQDLFGRPQAGETSVVVLGNLEGEVMKGQSLAAELKAKTMSSSNSKILDVPIVAVDMVVCQNNCSGHGECVQNSRDCRCHSWWMESTFRRHFGDGSPNCDWSVIYVFIGTIGSVLVSGVVFWLIVILVVRNVGSGAEPRRKTGRYSLLDNREDLKVRSRVPGSLLESGSESDSENETLFDSRKPRSNKNDKIKNGHIRLQRIRT